MTGFTFEVSHKGLKFRLSPLRLPIPPLGHGGLYSVNPAIAPVERLGLGRRDLLDFLLDDQNVDRRGIKHVLGVGRKCFGTPGMYKASDPNPGATFSIHGASIRTVTRLAEIGVLEDVLVRARAGDDAAQAEIYTAVAPATFALIRRLVGSRAVAEDLFQDTLMTALERLPTYRNEAPFGAWVRRIAITRTLMYLRSPWHRARLQLIDHSSDATPAPVAESLDIERALATLSPTARSVVWLYEVEGFSHEEIAQAFGRSISFSKSQLARAHRRLREWFEPQTGRRPTTPVRTL